MSSIFYVASVLMRDIEVESVNYGMPPSTVKFECDDGMIGAMPVFDTREHAESAYPDAAIFKITG